MAKMFMKGRILQIIKEKKIIWDYELAKTILDEYQLTGDYWKGTIRATITDLLSNGLVESIEEKMDDDKFFGLNKILFKLKLTDFGLSRMEDTRLA